jgi:hypothetical protein
MSKRVLFLSCLVLLFWVSSCEDEDEKEQNIAKQISENICKDDDRSGDWFECIMCFQGMNPYKLKQEGECNKEARNQMYSDTALSASTKEKFCGGMQDYTTKLKEVVVDWKGDIKGCCSTEDGMKDFFQAKMDCFMACEEDPPNKGKCREG